MDHHCRPETLRRTRMRSRVHFFAEPGLCRQRSGRQDHDLAKYGLNTPSLTVTVTTNNGKISDACTLATMYRPALWSTRG